MIKTPEVYEFIKHGNEDKVKEYLDQFNNTANKLVLEKLQNLLAYAIDWKQLCIIKLLIEYSANPRMINRFAMYYATQNTNAIPDLNIIVYLKQNQTLCEYIRDCDVCKQEINNCSCSCSNCNIKLVDCKCK